MRWLQSVDAELVVSHARAFWVGLTFDTDNNTFVTLILVMTLVPKGIGVMRIRCKVLFSAATQRSTVRLARGRICFAVKKASRGIAALN